MLFRRYLGKSDPVITSTAPRRATASASGPPKPTSPTDGATGVGTEVGAGTVVGMKVGVAVSLVVSVAVGVANGATTGIVVGVAVGLPPWGPTGTLVEVAMPGLIATSRFDQTRANRWNFRTKGANREPFDMSKVV